MKISSYRDLEVWQKAMQLADAVYDATFAFPKDEIYGLSSQLRRAAVSVASNIAEGSARAGTKELLHFINIARGSLAELETQIEIARRRAYIAGVMLEKVTLLAADVGKMLVRLSQSLRA